MIFVRDSNLVWAGALQGALRWGGEGSTAADGGGRAEQATTREAVGAVLGCNAGDTLPPISLLH